ncbi:SRPBCC domain-containing protein [Pseudomarimonas arenosa]|uniref:SRPBCC domain-containing protein n=1 Tax=Pseudomarimonas arenosa TaxID=2774145 RepID=A0AAW3ZGS5_9GAMM|nr:SRPBCC domain-containing protein [Pseudomarimonas arenosa]MBD8525318.1 SRPBCC domain-containing protein [Pseudomarimonas arenosa]
MSAAFIYLAPLCVGAITVYVAERQRRRTWAYYLIAPMMANALFITGTLMILIEGLICAILILPLFSLYGVLGGLLMGAICRWTQWPKQTLYGFTVLPLLLGLVEPSSVGPDRYRKIERSVYVEAPPAVIWRFLHNTGQIQPDEVEHGWIYRIGVPLPEIGQSEQSGADTIRRIRMGKGIHFDQIVQQQEPERFVQWTYRFSPDSVPAQALDDHVKIGGHYFDMLTTSYAISPRGSGAELRIQMEYRVSTQFNWYAVPLADALFGNFEETILDFYRRRSEAAATLKQT